MGTIVQQALGPGVRNRVIYGALHGSPEQAGEVARDRKKTNASNPLGLLIFRKRRTANWQAQM
ncbi:MAG TPA: hypothetical protein VI636_09955 [Candidatus Angelobacter sp.]